MTEINEKYEYSLQVELISEKGNDLLNIESLILAILVKTYGSIGETQLKYDIKELTNKKELEINRKTAYIKTTKKDFSKIWTALAWHGGNESQKQRFFITSDIMKS